MRLTDQDFNTQIVAVLQEAINSCWTGSQPKALPIPSHQAEDLVAAIEFCSAANRVIKYFGGHPVPLCQITEQV
jgi:hypothetical protein